jgi:ABC-type amino acid transport substrate-binding protein
MRIRPLTTLVAIVAAGLLVAACGGDAKPASDKAAGAVRQSWTVGLDAAFQPFAFYQDKKLVGFDVDLSEALAKEMGVELKIEPTAWDGIIPALNAKQIDTVPAMAVTEERKQQVLFTDPVIEQGITTVVKADRADFNPGRDDLDGLKVGVQVNTASAATAKEISGAKVTEYNSAEDAYKDLLLGRLDTVAIESTNAGYTASKIYPGKLRVTNQELAKAKVPVAQALRKEDTDLHGKMNAALDAMRQDGTLDRIVKKWFGDIEY